MDQLFFFYVRLILFFSTPERSFTWNEEFMKRLNPEIFNMKISSFAL